MNYSMIFIIVLVFASACSNKSEHDSNTIKLDSAVLGKYHAGYFDIGTDIILKEDGTFELRHYIYTDVIVENDENQETGRLSITHGTYSSSRNSISLNPKTMVRKQVLKIREVMLDSIPYYKSDSTFLAINYHIVKWNGNVYLLSEESDENDFIQFANDYNSGGEPSYLGLYFGKRKETKRRERLDVNQIPEKWRGYFLDSVISIKITGIEKDYKVNKAINLRYYRYEVNGGEELGVKEGMEFFGDNGCRILTITEVTKLSAKGIIELYPFQQDTCKIGDVLVSWNERDHGKFEKRYHHPVNKRFGKKQ